MKFFIWCSHVCLCSFVLFCFVFVFCFFCFFGDTTPLQKQQFDHFSHEFIYLFIYLKGWWLISKFTLLRKTFILTVMARQQSIAAIVARMKQMNSRVKWWPGDAFSRDLHVFRGTDVSTPKNEEGTPQIIKMVRMGMVHWVSLSL